MECIIWDMYRSAILILAMEIFKVGGPVYRIGVGGGAASSIQVQGDNEAELDFGAVQRGDAEMEQKMNRVIRSCIEMGKDNPICSIHDQGAGGNGKPKVFSSIEIGLKNSFKSASYLRFANFNKIIYLP